MVLVVSGSHVTRWRLVASDDAGGGAYGMSGSHVTWWGLSGSHVTSWWLVAWQVTLFDVCRVLSVVGGSHVTHRSQARRQTGRQAGCR